MPSAIIYQYASITGFTPMYEMEKTPAEQYSRTQLEGVNGRAVSLPKGDIARIDGNNITPLTSEYTTVLANMEATLDHYTSKLTEEEATVAAAIINNRSKTRQLEQAKMSKKRFDQLANSPSVKNMLSAVAAYEIVQAGGSRASRKLMLHDIAAQYKNTKPTASINALAEINRMEETEQGFILAREAAEQASQGGGVLFEFKIT